MQRTNRVAILDIHQATIDGYTYRLQMSPEIEVVSSFLNYAELEACFDSLKIDVLISGIDVPVSAENRNPFSILSLIKSLNVCMPEAKVLIISDITYPQIIDLLIKKGINGFVSKDDQVSIQMLGRVVGIIAGGGNYLSESIRQALINYYDAKLLSDRQFEALMICAAYPDEDTLTLAKYMGISGSTLRNFLSIVYSKLNVRTRAAAIIKARELGLIPQPSRTEEFLSNPVVRKKYLI